MTTLTDTSLASLIARVDQTIEDCIDVMQHLAKGRERNHEEDGSYTECPSCKSWISHYGHSPDCHLLVMSKRAAAARELLKALPPPAQQADYRIPLQPRLEPCPTCNGSRRLRIVADACRPEREVDCYTCVGIPIPGTSVTFRV